MDLEFRMELVVEILKPSTYVTIAREEDTSGEEEVREGTQQFKLLAEEDAGPMETEKEFPACVVFLHQVGLELM